jgi:hypothetical protein
MFVPLGAFFKLAFFEAAPVVVSCSLFRPESILERENDDFDFFAALPLRSFWVPILTAVGGLCASSFSELVLCHRLGA